MAQMQLNTASRIYLNQTSISESNHNYKMVLLLGIIEMPSHKAINKAEDFTNLQKVQISTDINT